MELGTDTLAIVAIYKKCTNCTKHVQILDQKRLET